MNYVTLHFKATSNFRHFANFWSSFYDYKDADSYVPIIGKATFKAGDIEMLYKWKNGRPLSQKKQQTLKTILGKLEVVNGLKQEFDMEVFQQEFSRIAAIWKIFLLHIISPTRHPIYDQHVYRAYYFLTHSKLKEIALYQPTKEKSYFSEYLPFFNGLISEGINRKQLDEALWVFGKFLKTEIGQHLAGERGLIP
jgi:hypothetical protein